MLSDRNTPYNCLEILQRREPLAHVEPGVHLRHDGWAESSSEEAGQIEQQTELLRRFYIQCHQRANGN